MNFETLNNGSFKKIAIGILVSIALFSVLILSLSLAKYRSTNSINIAKGTIKYNRPGEYALASDVPESGYVLNEDTTKTRCKNKDGSLADITITYENGGLSFSKLTTGGVKCYVFFDKIVNAADKIPDGKPTDDNMFAGIEGDGIYTWTKGDYSGGDQPIKYFRGNVNNNWVVFGKDGNQYIWWRIIRNNSNGSLRMIYAGLSSSKTSAPAATGSGTAIGRKSFNTSTDNNMYVGFKYTNGNAHGNGTNSTILGTETSTDTTTLYGWYNAKLKTNYTNYIDIDAGFCNDRTPGDRGTGIGTERTSYAAISRVGTLNAASPSLLCTSTDDIFKVPVGLITADEVNMGGIVYNSGGSETIENTASYLYIYDSYWTMTPNEFWLSKAKMFFVSNGHLKMYETYQQMNVRPVINLKADTIFISGNGEASTPFVVEGT